MVKMAWQAAEDRRLLELVQIHGPKGWATIATAISGRSGKQCRERWLNHLNPDVRKDAFSPQEDKIIMTYVESFGTRWAKIAAQLPGRTDNAVKNRYYSTLRRRQSVSSDPRMSPLLQGGHRGASPPLPLTRIGVPRAISKFK